MVVWKFFPCPEGGAERQCRKLVTELSKQGHSCLVLTSHTRLGLQQEEESPAGYRVQRFGRFSWLEEAFKRRFQALWEKIPWAISDHLSNAVEFWLALPFVWLSRLSFMLDLRKFFQENKKQIDIIHVHEAHWIAGAVAWASQGLKLPLVCKEASFPAVNKLSYDTPFRKTLTQLRRQVNFIALTTAVKKSLHRIGIAEEQITLIPNGVQLPKERSPLVGARDIVYIGNLTQGTQWKAFDILFEAWVLAQKQDEGLSRLVVLGAGDSAGWQKYLEQHHCLDTVHFAGRVDDVAPYLYNARLFLLPSRVEGLSNALLEAMSWGLPVIVSDIPANCSLVQHQINGWVVPVNNSRALAEAILNLLEDEPLSLQLGQAARQEITEHYTITRVTTLLLNLYNELIEQKQKNASIN